MADLNMDECDHLMGIWRICVLCETTIGREMYIYGCNCLYHSNCPVPHVREDHSCSLEFKQQLITNYVKKTFSTDDVRSAYKNHMENFFFNLMIGRNTSNLTEEECNLLMRCWRICYYCETKVKDIQVGWIWPCQCLIHYPNCPVPRVRDYHPSSACSLQLKTEIVTNYVRKTYQSDNVRTAFKTYMEENLPGLVAEAKPDEKTVRIAELEKENKKNLKKLTEARQMCEELTKKNSKLETENERLKNEKQQEIERIQQVENEKQDLIQEHNKTREELDKTTGKLAKLSYEIREMKKKWSEVRGENCADFKEEELDEEVLEESDECMFDYEWDNFKQHFKELEEKISDLGQRSFASRNSKFIGAISQKIVPTVQISSRVKGEVIELLKKGGSELKVALDDLLPLESQFPTSSSNKKKEHPDIKLLE